MLVGRPKMVNGGLNIDSQLIICRICARSILATYGLETRLESSSLTRPKSDVSQHGSISNQLGIHAARNFRFPNIFPKLMK